MDIEFNLRTDTVEQLEAPEPLCVDPSKTVREVLVLLKQHRTGSTLVCRDGVLVGIFTERDALRLMASGGRLDDPIEKVMSRNPATLRPGETVGRAIRVMSSGGYRRLPVVDEKGRPVRFVKVSNIVHYLVQHFPNAVYNLPPSPGPVILEREGP